MIAATFAVRAATEIERRKLAGVLYPQTEAATVDIIVAAAEGESPLGAAVTWYTPSRHFPEHANLRMLVLESHRRQGVGRTLLKSVIDAARKVGARDLCGPAIDQQSIGFLFAMSTGFQPQPATFNYEAPMEDYIKAFTPVYERLARKGRIPARARIVPLKEANREEVCRLIMDNLGFPSQGLAERLRGTEHGFSQTISRVALLDGKMVGATLMTFQKAVATVIGTAVLQEHRNSWVNAALKYHVMQELIARDVKWVRFSASETQHRDTSNFARRIKAKVLSKVSAVVMDLK